MGRRALRPIDPTLDLSRHFAVLENVAQPFDPLAIFGRSAPLEIEVGSGKGLFLSAAAAGDSRGDFLGIEIVGRYARFTAARLAQRELANARIIHGDAQHFFRSWLSDESVRAVHVYFPDPWWKARHRKRRVMNADFLRDVERVLVPGGTLHFWTDVREYYETTLALVAAESKLDGPHRVSEKPADHDLDYRTHFERRMRLHNEPVHRAEFRKREKGGAPV
jgi:tRNA (guanine-N7-)-methyltransferase